MYPVVYRCLVLLAVPILRQRKFSLGPRSCTTVFRGATTGPSLIKGEWGGGGGGGEKGKHAFDGW